MVEAPFVKYFEYGYCAGKERYWMYDHMAVQFEDCMDCVQALYPHFYTVWMFENSCNHDSVREDGLVVSNMSTTWGGKQRKIRDTDIKQEMGYLGPHSPQLYVESIQHRVFQEVDQGQYYLPPNPQAKKFENMMQLEVKR